MSDLLFLGALSCLHEVFKCPIGLREAVLVATLEALLAAAAPSSRAGERTLSSLGGAWPGCAGCAICMRVLLLGATLSAQ